ncbi:methionine ABC transporter ATP-binding protein [Acinetobacter sp. ESL0695]|uniref:methionine ABC transporter ATP-binding protein n=1 Tax=Acinetobacter sp. ESL0695 TaxID=2983215 RepID=UPI0023F3201A|nr:methionine ABC transporter ATP-binding protein [Acinetobacter sp. ESL0695]WEV47853.1 methionine ABC transporter ATP-binding protein [Acinetobacter sp. ESL0695]
MNAQIHQNAVLDVSIKGVNKYYANQVHALKDIHLEVKQGVICGVIGRSGAGKSSLLRTLNGLESISTGQLHVLGETISELNYTDLIRLRQRVGMIFQHFNLMSTKTVWENVALPLIVAGVKTQEIISRVEKILALVGLENKKESYPSQLSGGQKQRVGIARALIHNPEILLCDEATSALDPESTQMILKLLKKVNKQLGITIILITHEMQVIRDLCDEVVVIDQGEIIEKGAVWKVFSSPQKMITKELLYPEDNIVSLPLDVELQNNHQYQVVNIRYAYAIGKLFNLQNLLQRLSSVALFYSRIDQIQEYYVGELQLAYPIHYTIPHHLKQELGLEILDIQEIGYVESIV